jgi:hypothetical protein
MVIFEDDSVKLEFDPDIPCIIWKPLKFLSNESWRTPFVRGLDFAEDSIRNSPKIGWINDARLLKIVKPEDLLWLSKNVNDRAYKIGIEKIAFVMPDSAFGKWAVKFYTDYTKNRKDINLQIESFGAIQEAKKWISTTVNIEIREVNVK